MSHSALYYPAIGASTLVAFAAAIESANSYYNYGECSTAEGAEHSLTDSLPLGSRVAGAICWAALSCAVYLGAEFYASWKAEGEPSELERTVQNVIHRALTWNLMSSERFDLHEALRTTPSHEGEEVTDKVVDLSTKSKEANIINNQIRYISGLIHTYCPDIPPELIASAARINHVHVVGLRCEVVDCGDVLELEIEHDNKTIIDGKSYGEGLFDCRYLSANPTDETINESRLIAMLREARLMPLEKPRSLPIY